MTCAWLRGHLLPAPPVASPVGPLVIKLGGSLLARPDWPGRIASLLEPLANPWLMVVGGGPLVDALRAVDAACPRPPALMHALAIDAMGITARLMAVTLGVPLVAEPHPVPSTGILDAPTWLRGGDRMQQLPIGWDVTSDSIAAFVATCVGGRLLLVKSVPPPCPGDDREAMAAAGWVDGHFPQASRGLTSISWAAPAADG